MATLKLLIGEDNVAISALMAEIHAVSHCREAADRVDGGNSTGSSWNFKCRIFRTAAKEMLDIRRWSVRVPIHAELCEVGSRTLPGAPGTLAKGESIGMANLQPGGAKLSFLV
jgi:hypothetical protein